MGIPAMVERDFVLFKDASGVRSSGNFSCIRARGRQQTAGLP